MPVYSPENDWVLVDVIANLPGAGDFEGQKFIATDQQGPTEYVWDGTEWLRLTLWELAYDDTTTSWLSVPATRTDFPNLDVLSFDVEAGRVVYVEAFAPGTHYNVANNPLFLYVSDNAGADAAAAIKAESWTAGPTTATIYTGSARAVERITTPGSYARKAQGLALGGPSGATRGFSAAATRCVYIRAYEAPASA